MAVKFNQSHLQTEVSHLETRKKQNKEEVCCNCRPRQRPDPGPEGVLLKINWQCCVFTAVSDFHGWLITHRESGPFAELFVLAEGNKQLSKHIKISFLYCQLGQS